MNVGDKVMYIPCVAHALNRNHHGIFAWRFEEIDHTGTAKGILTDKQLQDTLAFADKMGDKKVMKRLRPVCPNVQLKAVITEINENGICLDVQGHQGGVTLHENCVKEDPTGTLPHSCHKLEADG